MLEATMVLMDSSSWAINTDTGLTRWATQLDCAKMLFNAKTTSNPENVVGVMTMAGKGPEVLASPTQNYGAIVSALSNVRLEGEIDLITSIQVAQLALKHRQNKNLRQRIIALVGSPLESTTADDLVKLGKRLKKNNVACDIINFGEDAENEDKLAGFVEAVTSQNNSHLVTVPAGTVLLSDMIHSSGMLSEDGVPTANGSGSGGGGTSGTGAGSGAGEDGEYGVDPNLDPELAMALRMSLEEERARQAASQRSQGQSNNPEQLAAIPETSAPSTSGPDSSSAATSALTPKLSQAAASGPASASDVNVPDTSQQSAMASSPLSSLSSTSAERRSGGISAVKTEEEDESMEADEDADLARALALSRGGEGIDGGGGGGDDNDEDHDMADAHGANEGDDGEISEEEAMARAIALSMQDQNQDKTQ